MKILARHKPRADHMIPGGIVELSEDEMELLSDLKYDQGKCIYPGATVEISKRFRHAMQVLKHADEAKKLPNALRALADTLEMTHPAIEKIEAEPEKETDE